METARGASVGDGAGGRRGVVMACITAFRDYVRGYPTFRHVLVVEWSFRWSVR